MTAPSGPGSGAAAPGEDLAPDSRAPSSNPAATSEAGAGSEARVSPRGGVLAAWLEVTRASNFLTCVTNALAGVALAAPSQASFPWRRWALAAGATTLFYAAGMILNDLLDREVDRLERPGRPIPSGRVGPGAAALAAATCGLAALVLLALAGAAALGAGLVLAAAIVAYDLLHRRGAASVLLMGLCRGLVYVVSAAVAGWPEGGWSVGRLGIFAAALAAYVVLLSLAAREEAAARQDAARRVAARRLAWLLPLAALLPLAVSPPQTWMAGGALVLLAALLIAATRPRFAALVSRFPRTTASGSEGQRHGAWTLRDLVAIWIAAICLVDALFLAALLPWTGAGASALLPVLVAVVCWGATLLAQRRVAGT